MLGICGGMQMLGDAMTDPYGVDGAAQGLGLLPLTTRFEPEKLLRRTTVTFGPMDGDGPWGVLGGVGFDGYEIRHGRTQMTGVEAGDGGGAVVAARSQDGQAVGWRRGSVLGLSAHGLFEAAPPLRALLGTTPRSLDDIFDGLADFVDRHFIAGHLAGLTRL